MKRKKRHIWLYKFLRVAVTPYLKWQLRYQRRLAGDMETPYIVLANHTTNYDPIMVSASFPQQMYFVASEHIYRWGFASKLLEWCFAPIARAKGSTDARTVLEVLRCIHAGSNVCVFAEGNRTFNGVTCEILPSTGKLVKASGAMLVTYKIEGGYFAYPRWGKTLRRGRTRGYVVGKYPAAQLRQMSAEEVNALIERDLYEDAYARQREDPVRFRGKRLAEGLETALYLCPLCGRIGTMHGDGDQLRCGCGLSVRYTELGEIKGDGVPFSTITEWDVWQSDQMAKLAETAGEDPLCMDENQKLFGVNAATESRLLTTDTLFLYHDRLACGTYSFPIRDISNMAIYGQMTLVFTTADGAYYEIVSEKQRSATKYFSLYRALKKIG